jgi:hypothetical protein
MERRRAWGALRALVVASVAAASCGPSLYVKTDYDRAVSFSQFRTFRMGQGQLIQQGEMSPNPLVKDRIDNNVQAQLMARGLVPAGQDADLIVRYVAGARTVQELEAVDYPIGPVGPYWGPAYPADFWVQSYPQGTLVIDLYDARTNKVVWRAYCRAEGEGISDPAFIQKTVARAFESFPPRA